MTNITLDDLVVDVVVNGGPIPSLAPGASDNSTFWGTYQVTQIDIDRGRFENLATACGDHPDGEACDDDPEDVLLPGAMIAVPTLSAWSVILMVMALLTSGWYFRPQDVRKS